MPGPRLQRAATRKGVFGGEEEGGGVRSGPGAARTILLFHIISARPSKQPRSGEGAWDHNNSCLHHASNWTCAHDHVLRALERICNDADFASTHKRVLKSEGNRRANLEIRNIRVGRPICW